MNKQILLVSGVVIVLSGCGDSDKATNLSDSYLSTIQPETGAASPDGSVAGSDLPQNSLVGGESLSEILEVLAAQPENAESGVSTLESTVGETSQVDNIIQSPTISVDSESTISEFAANTDGSAQAETIALTESIVAIDESPFAASLASNGTDASLEPTSETANFLADPNFLFDTASTILLKVDLQDAVGTEGSLSLCTDYQETTAGYRINYQKCPIQGLVSNGQFEHQMELMNQFDSAIAVIWFPNQEFAPRYKTFNLAELPEGAGSYEWLWD